MADFDVKKIVEDELALMAEEKRAQGDVLAQAQAAKAQTLNSAEEVITAQKQKDFNAIMENDEFKQLSARVNAEDVAIGLDEKQVTNEQRKQAVEIARYRTKLLKKAMREEAKAESQFRKRKAMETRYGYLYKTKEVTIIDEHGQEVKELRYENFSCSHFINKYKEFGAWWANLTEETRRNIWKGFKLALRIALVAGLVCGIYFGIKALINSGILNIAFGV